MCVEQVYRDIRNIRANEADSLELTDICRLLYLVHLDGVILSIGNRASGAAGCTSRIATFP